MRSLIHIETSPSAKEYEDVFTLMDENELISAKKDFPWLLFTVIPETDPRYNEIFAQSQKEEEEEVRVVGFENMTGMIPPIIFEKGDEK